MLLYDKELKVSTVGGLGNRLLGIISTIWMIETKKYDSATIYWDKRHHCDINFDEIVCLKHNKIRIIYNKNFKKMTDINKIDKDNFIEACDMYGPKLKITDWAKNNINKFIKFKVNDDNNYQIGLHCRRTDWGMTDNDNTRIISLEDAALNHIKLDERCVNYIISNFKNQKIFVSTDSVNTIGFLKLKLPNTVIYNEKQYYPVYSSRSNLSMIEAIKDLVSLSKCELIIRDSTSTFPFISSVIGNKELITLNRSNLINSGAGIRTRYEF